MSNIKIDLARFEIKTSDTQGDGYFYSMTDLLGSYPLIVRASGTNIADEIFVYHVMGSADPYENDMFEAIATPTQLEELPINQGVSSLGLENEAIPYYRRNQLELYCRSPSEVEQIWTELQAEVKALVENMNAMARLSGIEIVEVTEHHVTESDKCSDSEFHTLHYDPATSTDLDEKGIIIIPDPSVPGWLPISEIESVHGLEVGQYPATARLFYNIKKHPELYEKFQTLPEPYLIHQLQIDDLPYPQATSGVYTITQDTIYWLDFDPADFSDDIKNLPPPPKNPWPTDYFVGVPSTSPRVLRLLLNCSEDSAV